MKFKFIRLTLRTILAVILHLLVTGMYINILSKCRAWFIYLHKHCVWNCWFCHANVVALNFIQYKFMYWIPSTTGMYKNICVWLRFPNCVSYNWSCFFKNFVPVYPQRSFIVWTHSGYDSQCCQYLSMLGFIIIHVHNSNSHFLSIAQISASKWQFFTQYFECFKPPFEHLVHRIFRCFRFIRPVTSLCYLSAVFEYPTI